MLNAEKYKNEILEKSNVLFDFSISKDRHTIEKCLGGCDDCIFCNIGEHCSNVKVKWLLSEYKETIKLSRLEYEFLKYCLRENYEYIVRDECSALCVFSSKPKKMNFVWGPRESMLRVESIPERFFKNLFNFIKCEDTEPRSIKDILENCEVVEDAEE